MAIHFDCPSCGDAHPSRLVVTSREEFCALTFHEHPERCPLTREEVLLSHWDAFWRDRSYSPAGYVDGVRAQRILRVDRSWRPRSIFTRR
jgi:hypothetical protein